MKNVSMKRIKPMFSKQMRVAGILDELSERFFPWDCVFFNLNYSSWREEIEKLQPDILFVESIWNGHKKSWRKKLTPFVDKNFNELINWCKNRDIKTVFWNKEDPVHMLTFLHVASFFDIVLTTDFDCVPLYRRLLKHNNVYVMPFACSPRLFTPVEKYDRKKAVCFAGSYYRKRKERSEDFKHIMDNLEGLWDIDIYDRNPYPDDLDYSYPEKYQKYIRGTLPVDKIDIAYKSYLFGITLNIVKYSSTMEARRAFELLSSNTLILSNPCQGLKNLLGDLILFSDKSFKERLIQLSKDNNLYGKIRLAGLRKALIEHTYESRMDFIYYLIYNKKPKTSLPEIILYSDVENQTQLNHIINVYKKQKYMQKKIIIFTDENIYDFSENDGIFILSKKRKKINLFYGADYCGYLSPNHYYGENYLTDLALATKYSVVTAIGKKCFYSYKNNVFMIDDLSLKYQMTTSIQKDRCILPVKEANSLDWLSLDGNDKLNDIPCMSVDEFNFCEYWQGPNCPAVDDIEIDTGISMEELYKISLIKKYKNPEQYYTMQWIKEGLDLNNLIRSKLIFDESKIALSNNDKYGVGIYSKSNEINTRVVLDYRFDAKEYSNNFSELNIFIDGNFIVKGDSHFYCFYYDEKDKHIGSYLLHSFGSTSLPVQKEGFSYFRIGIIVKGFFFVVFNELIINPRPKNNLDLLKMEEVI